MSYERTTPCGQIAGCGCQWPGVAAYKGIRYATAGRWEYPRPVTHWDGVYQATAYGAACFQPRSFYDEAQVPEKAFYYHEFREGEHYDYSEDCLFLNIWTPENAAPGAKLPVLFYIHGGGFTGGCGNEKHFDGPAWPTKGVVAVTINYRLGPLGFACLLIGGAVLVYGVVRLAAYLRGGEYADRLDLFLGVLLILLGLFLLVWIRFLITLIPVVLGIYIIVDSLAAVKRSLSMKALGYDRWWISCLVAAVLALCGLVMVLNPFGTVENLVMFIGLGFLFDGVSSLVNTILLERLSR